jgi:hypothetical protein
VLQRIRLSEWLRHNTPECSDLGPDLGLNMTNDDPAILLKALKDLSAMYTYTWDAVDGTLWMSPDGTKLFERRHAAAQKAIETFEALQKPASSATLREAEINMKLWAKTVEKLRDRECARSGHVKGGGAFDGYSYCKTCGSQISNTDFGLKGLKRLQERRKSAGGAGREQTCR